MQKLEKEPGDQVTCVRVYDDFYRCNWWAPGDDPSARGSLFHGLEVSTFRVRKSFFVRATMTDGQLVIVDATIKPVVT